MLKIGVNRLSQLDSSGKEEESSKRHNSKNIYQKYQSNMFFRRKVIPSLLNQENDK